MINTGGRKILFEALVGSHNYNLNTLESDKDYKIFVLPTFDDLYNNKQFSNSIIGLEVDYDIHDVRKVSELWWKANINFIEVLFSEDIIIGCDLNMETKELIQDIFDMRNELVTMNLPYLYNACIGMHYNKMKLLEKGTEGTKYLVDKFGWDTKQGLHAYRVLDFLTRFADNDFTDFKEAILYDTNNSYDQSDRELLLDIKNGKFTIDEYKKITSELLIVVKRDYEPIYKSESINEGTNNKLIEIVKKIVKINLEMA